MSTNLIFFITFIKTLIFLTITMLDEIDILKGINMNNIRPSDHDSLLSS